MHFLTKALCFLTVVALSLAFTSEEGEKSVHDFTVQDINGNDKSLADYKGKVLLIVNVASRCGLTPQYEQLQALYEEQAENGLEILGFPANNFMGQEPGSDEEIKAFCSSEYNVTFPMFSKISVKGKNQHPLYEYLTNKEKNGKLDAPVQWNFQKFLINEQGEILEVFSPREKVSDEAVLEKIRKALEA